MKKYIKSYILLFFLFISAGLLNGQTGCDLLKKLSDDLASNGSTLRPYFESPANASAKLIKAWESALKNGVDDIIRRKPEFLEMLSKYPYGTSKQTLIDNATADEWTQIFSGSLKKANNPDPNAAALVAEYGGESGVIFKTDPSGKEFDLISPTLIGEHKVINTTSAINSGDRHSYRMQFIACQKQNKSGLWVFEGVQNDSHIDKVIEYANEYKINTVIKLNGTIIHNLTF